MKKQIKRRARKTKLPSFFLDELFIKYRKYRNHRRYVHVDLL